MSWQNRRHPGAPESQRSGMGGQVRLCSMGIIRLTNPGLHRNMASRFEMCPSSLKLSLSPCSSPDCRDSAPLLSLELDFIVEPVSERVNKEMN